MRVEYFEIFVSFLICFLFDIHKTFHLIFGSCQFQNTHYLHCSIIFGGMNFGIFLSSCSSMSSQVTITWHCKLHFFLFPTGSAPQHARVSCTSHGRRSSKHFWSTGNQQDCFKYHKFLSESDYFGRGKPHTRIEGHISHITTHSVYFFSMTFNLFLAEAISL